MDKDKYKLLSYLDLLKNYSDYLFITEDLKLKILKQIKKVLKDFKIQPINSNIKTSELYQLRILHASYPLFLLTVEQPIDNCFIALILTMDIELGFITYYTPLIQLPNLKTLLVVLPLWIYIDKKILDKNSNFICNIFQNHSNYFYNYAKDINLNTISNISKIYINLIANQLADINTISLLTYIDELENLYQSSSLSSTNSNDS